MMQGYADSLEQLAALAVSDEQGRLAPCCHHAGIPGARISWVHVGHSDPGLFLKANIQLCR